MPVLDFGGQVVAKFQQSKQLACVIIKNTKN